MHKTATALSLADSAARLALQLAARKRRNKADVDDDYDDMI